MFQGLIVLTRQGHSGTCNSHTVDGKYLWNKFRKPFSLEKKTALGMPVERSGLSENRGPFFTEKYSLEHAR